MKYSLILVALQFIFNAGAQTTTSVAKSRMLQVENSLAVGFLLALFFTTNQYYTVGDFNILKLNSINCVI